MSERTINEIICQYKYNGSTPQQIAKRLDLPVETVKAVIAEHC